MALAVPVTAFVLYTIVGEYRVGKRQAEQSALAAADATAASMSAFLRDGRTILGRIARKTSGRAPSGHACEEWHGDLGELLPQFSNLFFADPAGTVLCSSVAPDPVRPVSIADRPYFQEALRTGETVLGSPQVGRITGSRVVVLARPVRDSERTVTGVVGLAIDLMRFQGLLAGMRLAPDAVITVADAERTVVARSVDSDSWVGRTLPLSGVELSNPGRRGTARTRGPDGVARVWGHVEVPGSPWRVYAGIPEIWADGPFRQTAVARATLAFTIFFLAWLLSRIFYRRVVDSVASLVESTRAAAKGEPVELPGKAPLEVTHVLDQINRTLSARAQAEAEVRRAELRYRSILNNAVFGIYLSTREGKFLAVNPALVTMLGYESAEELLTVDVAQLYANPHERESLIRKYQDAEVIKGLEVEWRKKDGSSIRVELNGVTVRDERGELAFEMIVEDVTRQRILEGQLRQSQKMEAIGRLAGGIAHDFNNMLTVITGRAELLEADLPEASALRGNAREIVESAERAARLTRQLLAFGRKQMVRAAAVDLNEIITRLDDMLGPIIGKDVSVSTHLAADLLPCLGDASQIEQVVMNLVINARDAMPDGGRIVIRTANRTLDGSAPLSQLAVDPGSFVALSVSDSGTGIDPAIQPLIFEPFFTTKAEGVGTGLGLSTVYGIVSQAGGGLDVQSGQEGTCFTVLFPAAPGLARAGAPSPAGRAADGGTETVLVVDDDDGVRGVVCEALRRRGYSVLEADSGERAMEVEAGYRAPIDLLLTDVVMPGLKGPDLAERLAVRRPEMKIVFMSGHAEGPELRERVLGPSTSFIRKPFSPDEVAAHLRDVLQSPHRGAA